MGPWNRVGDYQRAKAVNKWHPCSPNESQVKTPESRKYESQVMIPDLAELAHL